MYLRRAFLKLKESVDSLLPALEDAAQFLTLSVTDADDVAQGNRLASQFGGDGLAEKAVLTEDADVPISRGS